MIRGASLVILFLLAFDCDNIVSGFFACDVGGIKRMGRFCAEERCGCFLTALLNASFFQVR